MAACPKCGSQVTDGTKFCSACGAAVESASSTPPALPSQPPPPATAASGGQSGMAPNIAAMLTYIPLCFIGLVCAILFGFILDPYKKDRFVRFHAWQSLAVHGAFFALSIGWFIFSAVVTAIIHFFAIITFPISILISAGALVLMVILMIKAYGNESFKVPVIGDWADKKASG
jgi:uncharacterized membrane protein